MHSHTHPSRSRRTRWWPALVIVVLVAGLASPAAAADPEPVSFRIGHFSPGTPAMDLYLTGFDGKSNLVLRTLAYGEVSQYMRLTPGVYTITLRAAGSAPDAPAALVGSADLLAGKAYTFAAFGNPGSVEQRLLVDDLTPPPAGKARVRLIQAATDAAKVNVRVVDGPILISDALFAQSTGYAPVPAGAWRVQVSAAGTNIADVVRRLDLQPGTVNSLIVLRGASAREIALNRVVDANGAAPAQPIGPTPDQPKAAVAAVPAAPDTPVGGVNTGGGGTAPKPSDNAPIGALLAGVLAVVVIAGGFRVLRRRS